MNDLLPVGAYVAVAEPGLDDRPPYVYTAKVVGYDLGRTKYEDEYRKMVDQQQGVAW